MHQKSTHLIKSSAEAFRITTTEADVNHWLASFTMAKAIEKIQGKGFWRRQFIQNTP